MTDSAVWLGGSIIISEDRLLGMLVKDLSFLIFSFIFTVTFSLSPLSLLCVLGGNGGEAGEGTGCGGYPWRSEESIGYPGAGVTSSCELSKQMCWEPH